MEKFEDERVNKVLNELTENGFSLQDLSREVGYGGSTLGVYKARKDRCPRIQDLVELLKVKAKILTGYDPQRHSLTYVCKEASLKQSHLAKRIGITKQGLHKLQYNLSEERKQQLKKELKDLSATVKRLAQQLEKIY